MLYPSSATRRHITVLVYAALLFNEAASAQSSNLGNLQVVVTGIKSNQGQVIANLFREGDDIFSRPVATKKLTIVDDQLLLIFPNLEAGRYAVVAFQDINNNNDLDHNMLRLPAEPLGFSNGFELSLISGMPDSHKLAFSVKSATDTVINIKVK